MENLNIWDYQHKDLKHEVITYRVELVNYEYSEPLEFETARKQFDIGIEVFLDLFHLEKRNPARVELSGNAYLIKLNDNNKITIEKLNDFYSEPGSLNLIGRW